MKLDSLPFGCLVAAAFRIMLLQGYCRCLSTRELTLTDSDIRQGSVPNKAGEAQKWIREL